MKAVTLASVAVLFGASLVTASPLARRDAAQIQASVTRLAGEATTAVEGTGACAAPCSAWLRASTSANGDQGKVVPCACESSALSAMSTCATCLGSAEGDDAKTVTDKCASLTTSSSSVTSISNSFAPASTMVDGDTPETINGTVATASTYDLSVGGATVTGVSSAAKTAAPSATKTAAPSASGSAGNTTQPASDNGNGAGKFGVSLVALGLVGIAGLV